MSNVHPTQRSRRLNPRALIILGLLLLVGLPALVVLKSARDRRGRSAFLSEAKARLEKKQSGLAINYLNQYLKLNPDDVEALDLKAKILFEGAETTKDPTLVLEALQACSLALGRAGDDAHRQVLRRRMIKLNLMIPERIRSAEALAQQLTAGKDVDAEALRLHALTLAYLAVYEKLPRSLDVALKEFERAEAKEPGDVETGEKLADVCRENMDVPEKAETLLDQMVSHTQGDPKKHAAALLARARHCLLVRAGEPEVKVKNAERAEQDVENAVKADPGGVDVRVLAAEIALQHHDTTAARHHLASIDEGRRDDRRIKIVEGQIELTEEHRDEAIQSWRAGLLRSGGNDADLTWRLANVLLETGRVSDAEPLMDQYRRLVGQETPDARYRYLHGLYLLKKNRSAEAITEFEAIRFKVDKSLEAPVYYLLGLAYEATRQTDKALEAYRQADDRSKDWTAPCSALARLQAATRPEDAIDTLQKGLALQPNDPALLTTLAKVLWSVEKKKPKERQSAAEIERLLGQGRKAAPGSVELALVEADFYTATGRSDEAIALLTTASGMNPKSPDVWLARANTLAGQGHLGDALSVLDEAIAAAGPKAAFYIARATIQTAKGQVNEAKKTLVDGLTRVPVEQRPLLFKVVGELSLARKDYTEARAAFDEWARLQPENPEPRMAELQVALQQGDEPGIARAVDAVKSASSPQAYYWRYARVMDLLRDRKEAPDSARDSSRLDEAEKLVTEIKTNDPQLVLGYLLEGQLSEKRLGALPEGRSGEKRKLVDKAIDAYQKALKLDAGLLALNPLVALLVREGRDAELDRLRESLSAQPAAFNRLAAVQALQMGNKGRAEQLAELAVKGDPQGLDTQVWQAEVLKSLGKPEKAEAAMRLLIDQQPDKPAPWIELLMLQVSQRKTADAAATVEQIRERVKTEYAEVLWAQCYRVVGNVRRATECYDDAVRRWPNDTTVLTSAVTFYEQIGRRSSAEEALRAIRRENPANAWAKRKLAVSLASRTGDRAAWDEALTLLGPEPRPDDVPEDLVTRASLYSLGPEPAHRRKAIDLLEGLVAELPDLNKVHEQVGRLWLQEGDAEKARPHAAKAAAGERADPEAILFYAGVLLALKDFGAAEGQLARLDAIEPDGLPVAELKARILVAKGKGSEGAKILEQAFSERSTTPEALVIGEKMVPLLLSLNQPDAAERVARQIADVTPRGRCVLAEVLAGRGKIDEAESLLVEVDKGGDHAAAGAAALALAAQPGGDARWAKLADRFMGDSGTAGPSKESLEGLLKLSLLRHLQGRYEDEIVAYEKMLALKPSNYQFLNNMAWTLSEEMGKPDKGLERIDEAIKRVGSQPQILDTRGVILTRLGRYDDAVRDLEAAARDYRDGMVYYHLARAYGKMGKANEARKYRDLARKAGITRERLQRSEMADWDAVMNP